jgi:uncharacterized protein (DUF302 family)
MSYHFTKILSGSMDQVESNVRAVLQENGFGVLTEIDVTATFAKKLDKKIRPYKILGACNPQFAYQAIEAEDKIGVMLPCNVILQQKSEGEVEVSAVDPMSSMQAIENPQLGEIAQQVQDLMKKVIEDL